MATRTLLLKTGKTLEVIIHAYLLMLFLSKKKDVPKSHRFFEALGDSSPAVQFMGSDNVAVSNGETWKKQRKVIIIVLILAKCCLN